MSVRRSVLSLFSGCGGLDLGFVNAGFTIKKAYDNWLPAVTTYKANAHLFGGDHIEAKSLNLADEEIDLADLPRVELILGGPPCQGFSFAGKQLKDDPRNRLYRNFIEIVNAVGPRVFVMENVKGMEAMALCAVVNDFQEIGYKVTHDRAYGPNYGVPQKRERVIIVGYRNDLKSSFSPPLAAYGELFSGIECPSMFETICDLPKPIEIENKGDFEQLDKTGHLRSHAYRPLPESVQQFVRHIPNGGYFGDAPRRTLPKRLRNILDNPERYRSPRLFPKPEPSGYAQTIPADTNASLGGVLAPDLLYNGRGRAKIVQSKEFTEKDLYTAPLPSRRLTPREAARLQTFPNEFIFKGSLSSQFKQIGNAVPVRMAEAFAKKIMMDLEYFDKKRKALAVGK